MTPGLRSRGQAPPSDFDRIVASLLEGVNIPHLLAEDRRCRPHPDNALTAILDAEWRSEWRTKFLRAWDRRTG